MRWRTRRTDDDFAAEIRAHLDVEADRLMDDGLDPEAARYAARRTFGSVLTAQERFYEARGLVWIDQLRQDVRYAWRGTFRSRAFAATTVLTLAVALSLTTVVFTIFNAYVLRPFAVHDPYSLHEIAWRSQTAGGRTYSWRAYEEMRDRRDLFGGVIAERQHFVFSEGRSLAASFVSGNYFETLKARVLLGRALSCVDAREPGREPVVVLSHHAWTRLFDRDPAALGRPIELNGYPFEIVGVMRPEFTGLDLYPRDLWLPVTLYTEVVKQDLFGPEQPRNIAVTGRLRPGVSPERAASALTPFMIRAVDEGDGVKAELRLQATPAAFSLEMVAVLSPVFAAFALVLVAACANVSNVMLARANARHREIGVRLSLGASRGRVVRQLLTEGLLISALACLAALALAGLVLRAGVSVVLATLPASLSALVRVAPLDFDVRVFLFAFTVAIATTLIFALLPALQATRLSLTHALRGEAASALGTSTLRGLLVVSQVAVSLVLIVVAATLARNGSAIGTTDLGFETGGVLSVNQRALGPSRIGPAVDALAGDPRVGLVAATRQNPLFGQLPKLPVRPEATSTVVPTTYQFVSPEYFPLLEIPIVRGRGFRPAEARSQALVGIVNVSGAKALWGGADPIGKTLRIRIDAPEAGANEVARLDRLGGPEHELSGTSEVTIVGVAKDVVSTFVYLGTDSSHLYLPTSPTSGHASGLLVRARSPNELRVDTTQTLIRRAHADALAFEVIPLDEMRAMQMYPLQAASWIGSLLGAIALGLSVSGLYGVLTYTLSQRVREIGIRMALGATAGAVVRLIVTQSSRLAGLGALAGFVVALSVMRALSSLIRLKNVSVLDLGAFLVALAVVAAATALAAYWPARRAARIDPSQTLRADG